jgi:hypothetical protein
MSRKHLHALLLGCALLPGVLWAATPELNPDHPEHYIVQKGDTLWDIAGRFLKDPWLWPDIWDVNPQVRNPHLIYPGDELVLAYENGRPVVRLQGPGGQAAPERPPEQPPAPEAAPQQPGERPVVKLSPQVRERPLARAAIPPIPMDALQPFLSRPRVVTVNEMEQAPYIVSVGKEHLVAGAGFQVYARGVDAPRNAGFTVYRLGHAYRDYPSGKILGYEALHVADGVLKQEGDPAVVLLTNSDREVLTGDRLFPVRQTEFERNFMPRAPGKPMTGRIISVLDGVTQIGQHQIVVLNLGRDDGIEPGYVLAVYQAGATVPDPYAGGYHQRVTLPDERAGVVMVFRPFERVSYALVMKATRAMHLHDKVLNP